MIERGLQITEQRLVVVAATIVLLSQLLFALCRVTDEFRFCCLARHIQNLRCHPPPDEFSSCEDLMSNLVLRLCVWLLAGVAIVGNSLVIVWRSRYTYCNQVSATSRPNYIIPCHNIKCLLFNQHYVNLCQRLVHLT